ncbi:MAG: 3-hydroxybutyryl-CoA dehydrogenase [Firmicutes bacterium]|nr:3-hydroxybutyryl-CoA dehydrogenase [Bacillota bacterium]
MRVLVIGAGTMGSGIAQCFAGIGPTYLYDVNNEVTIKAKVAIEKILERQVSRERMTVADKDLILNNLNLLEDLRELPGQVDLVIEAVAERAEIKKKLFQELKELNLGQPIWASNTSSLSITELAAHSPDPTAFIGMHFFNPAPVMKLVELIKGERTSDETLAQCQKIVEALGKTSVQVEEAPGFVVNRLLIPMINEAVAVLAEGVATPEDIDTAMKLGANHPMGPLALADFIGLDIVLDILNVLHDETLDPKYRPHLLLKKMVRAGKLGRKSNEGFYQYS